MNKPGKKRTDIVTNRFGIEFEVEIQFVKRDDFGREVNEWMMDNYNMAKMLAYKDRTLPMSKADESLAIAEQMNLLQLNTGR